MSIVTLKKMAVTPSQLKKAHQAVANIEYGPRAGRPGSTNYELSRMVLAHLAVLANAPAGVSIELTDIANSIPGDSGNYHLLHTRVGAQERHLGIRTRVDMFVNVHNETKGEITGQTRAVKGIRGRVFVTVV